jgi:hypothetical protein
MQISVNISEGTKRLLRAMTANRKQTPSEILQREGRDER